MQRTQPANPSNKEAVFHLLAVYHTYRLTSCSHHDSLSIMPSDKNLIRSIVVPEPLRRKGFAVEHTLLKVLRIEVVHIIRVALYDHSATRWVIL